MHHVSHWCPKAPGQSSKRVCGGTIQSMRAATAQMRPEAAFALPWTLGMAERTPCSPNPRKFMFPRCRRAAPRGPRSRARRHREVGPPFSPAFSHFLEPGKPIQRVCRVKRLFLYGTVRGPTSAEQGCSLSCAAVHVSCDRLRTAGSFCMTFGFVDAPEC